MNYNNQQRFQNQYNNKYSQYTQSYLNNNQFNSHVNNRNNHIDAQYNNQYNNKFDNRPNNIQFNDRTNNKRNYNNQYNTQYSNKSNNQVKSKNNLNNEDEEIKPKTKLYEKYNGPELISYAFEEFKNIYKNKVKNTTINSIVNGEIITTKPVNIFVDEECVYKNKIEINTVDEINKIPFENRDFIKFIDPKFDEKLKLSTKTLYNYQINAIKKIRELELNGWYINSKTHEKIRSNGWLLRLPIGSGKSLVFTYLALIYKSIPTNPIIISTSGINVPDAEMVQLKYYPYYYENVGYINGKENSVIVMKDYIQRPITVIITHRHLLQQLDNYIKTDFKKSLLNITKIKYATHPNEIDLNCDILITIGENDIIKRLTALSYEQPFMRVIIDDYTNMSGVDEFRQVLATSTIFVSGSGFERDKNKISPSYYTLKHVDVDKFSLVSNPEDTKKGILRDSVATFNLIGSETEFSTYAFVNEIEEYCMNRYNMNPCQIYPFIENNGNKLSDYMGLSFLIKNFDRFANAINNVEKDYNKGILNENRIKYYLQWKNIIKNQVEEQYYENNAIKKRKVNNPLYESLYKNNNNVSTTIQSMVNQRCNCCGLMVDHNYCWGFVSTCCGSFFCANCADSMTTSSLIIRENNKSDIIKQLVDKNNYYCIACHKLKPTYYVNTCRHKRNNIHAYNIIEEYMDVQDIKQNNGTKFDYYFKMLMEGLKPIKNNGKTIEIELEEKYDKTLLDNDEEIYKLVLPLFAKDRLSILAINQIEKTLNKLEIKPYNMNKIKPCILIYGCPDYMNKRVNDHFKLFSTNKDSSLYNLDILFKNNMGSLIGLHRNILAILVWNEPDNLDEIQQLIGRILRLNSWNNPLYFYITCKSISNKFEVSNIEPVKKISINSIETNDESDNELNDELNDELNNESNDNIPKKDLIDVSDDSDILLFDE
jgi:hypothetical protein